MNPLAFIRIAAGFLVALAFARAEGVSLGVVYQGEETAFELPCTNKGNQAIWVAEAVSSCDCLKARFKPVPVEPGKTVRLQFVYRSAVAGRFSVQVQLRGPEAAAVYATYAVTGFVAAKEWLLPAGQLLGNSVRQVAPSASEWVRDWSSACWRSQPRSIGRLFPSDVGPALQAQLLGFGLPQNPVIIDTVSRDRFVRMHIPRALNLPAFAIKSRGDLRTRQLVLVDEGFASDLLLEEAAGLRRAGFGRVVVLDGGLAAWMRQGGAMEGSESTPLAVTSLSAADFVRTSPGTEWSVLEVKDPVPGVAPLESAMVVDRPEDLAKVLPAVSQSAAGRQAPRILVIAPDQAICARIEARFGAMNPAPIYYLTGGRAALDAYRVEQASLVHQSHELVQIRANRGRPVAAGGCGTCPKSGSRQP